MELHTIGIALRVGDHSSTVVGVHGPGADQAS
jgi:hypothetical protein